MAPPAPEAAATDVAAEDAAPPPDADVIDADLRDAQPPPPPPACPGSVLRRVTAWPGGGLQITAELACPLDQVTVELEVAGGRRHAVAVEPLGHAVGLTGIVLVPAADPDAHAARVAAALDLLAGRPAGERFAIWSGGALHADLTGQRTIIAQRLRAIPTGEAAPPALDAIASQLAAAGGPWVPARDVVVFGANAPPQAGPVAVRAGDAPDGRDRLARLGWCPARGETEPVALWIGGERLALEAPTPLAHAAAQRCEARDAAADVYPLGDTVRLDLTDEQWAVYRQRVSDSSRDEDFELSVTFGDAAPIAATAHLRGKGSLNCRRKNYTVDLSGPEPRRLAGRAAGDEFLLLSMCLDDRYFNQTLTNHLLGPMGLFPLTWRTVRVTLRGEDRGVYLLLEKPQDSLRQNAIAMGAVLRRRTEPRGDPVELKYPDPPDEAARVRAEYEALSALVAEPPGGGLLAALEERLNLDGYLRWLAMMSALHNGDYIDEVYFYGSWERRADGDRLYFHTHGWDADDLFSSCHYSGQYALDDEAALTYCAEAALDRALTTDPAVYARYVDALAEVLDGPLAPASVDAALAALRAQMWPLLSREETCAAMQELATAMGGEPDCAAMRADIEARMEEMAAQIAERAAALRGSIVTWRGP